MRFQKGPLADGEFYEYVDSETFEMVRVHHDNFVLRAVLEEGPSGFGVAKFLDEAVSCGIRVSPLVIYLNSVLRLLCVVNHVLLMNWFAATSCKICQSCFLPSSLFFQGFFGFVVKLDRGSSGRGTQNHQIWIILAHLSGCHTKVMQAGRVVRQSGSTRKQRG